MASLTNLTELTIANERIVGKYKDIFLNKKKNIVSRRVWDKKGNQMIDIKGPFNEVEERYKAWLKESCTTVPLKYQCPDGFTGTIERIWADIENGQLHGCTVCA